MSDGPRNRAVGVATRREKCAGCGEWIEPGPPGDELEGDRIVANDDGDFVHEECAE